MIEQLIKKLKEKGYRITPQRRTILGNIVSAQEPLTVAELWEQVRLQHSEVGLDTMYRNINMLVDMDFLTPIEGTGKIGTRYELSERHHHHITCLKCGVIACIDCPVNHHFMEEINHHGYELIRHKVELYGLCASCKNR